MFLFVLALIVASFVVGVIFSSKLISIWNKIVSKFNAVIAKIKE